MRRNENLITLPTFKEALVIIGSVIGIIALSALLLSCNRSPDSKSSKATETAAVMAGIAYVESRDATDPYSLKSVASKNGDRAYGKYQIMGANIPIWTKEALGQPYSISVFVNTPLVQEATVFYRIANYVNEGYSKEDIACVWFSGRVCAKAGTSKDAYGTTVPQYVKVFTNGYNQYMQHL